MDTLLHGALSNAAVVAFLTPIVTVLGRVSRRPAFVHSLWLLVLLKLLTPPLWPVSFSWPVRSEPVLIPTESIALGPAQPAEPMDTLSRDALQEEAADGALEETGAPSPRAHALADTASPLPPASPAAEPLPFAEIPDPPATAMPASISWQSWLLSIWLSGSILWLALAGYRLYCFHRLLCFTQRAPAKLQERTRRLAERLGLARCPGVWVVPAPVSPLLWALAGEPRLLIPASLLERLTEEQWDTLLAHELAHLRRGDHWVRFLELAALGLYWWHPAVWWARRELREVEEQCCDAWVVWALPGAAEVYATALVEAVTYLSGARSALPLAASGIGQMHLLKRRLTMIMRGTTPRALSAAGSLAVLGLAAVLLTLYPTWAWTEQRPDGAGDQQTSGGTATTTGRLGGAADVAGPSADAEAQDHSAPANASGGFAGGVDAESRSRAYGSHGGGIIYSETVEDAQDEVALLRVQLEQRLAERREVQARLRQAKSAEQKVHRLARTNAADTSEVEHARIELEVQEARLAGKDAQVKEAELRLKQAQRRLDKLRGLAPPDREKGPDTGEPSGATGAAMMPSAPGKPGMIGAPYRPAGSLGAGAPMGPRWGRAPEAGTQMPGGPRFGGGIGGTAGMGGGFGPMRSGPGSASSYEHRLAEVEMKLQSLIDEMKSLRKEHHPDKPQGSSEPPAKR